MNNRYGKSKERGVFFYWEKKQKEKGDATMEEGSFSDGLRSNRTYEMLEAMVREKGFGNCRDSSKTSQKRNRVCLLCF
jgi:hypothetical protein